MSCRKDTESGMGEYSLRKPEEKKEKVYQSLSATDRETADLYEELYETVQ